MGNDDENPSATGVGGGPVSEPEPGAGPTPVPPADVAEGSPQPAGEEVEPELPPVPVGAEPVDPAAAQPEPSVPAEAASPVEPHAAEEEQPLRVEPVEPGTPDPAVAVAASPLMDPAAGQDAVGEDAAELAPAEPDQAPDLTASEEAVPSQDAPSEASELEPPSDLPPTGSAPTERALVEAATPEAATPESAAPGTPGTALPETSVAESAAAQTEDAEQDISDGDGAVAGALEPPGQLLGEDADAAVPAFRSARTLLAALVAAVVLLAALTAFLAVRSVSTRGGGGVEDARHDGLAAARSAARIVFSYDYRHLDKDFAAGKAVATGDFAKEYQRTTSKLVDDVAARYKAVVVADIGDAAVVSASKNQVVTLVFLSQQSTSTLNAGTKITQSRLEMTMVHRGGRWLVSKIRAF